MALHSIESKVEELESFYDENHKNYKFKYIFYNLTESEVLKNSEIPFSYYEKAPKNTYPLYIKGFNQLNERAEKQKEILRQLRGSIDYLQLKIGEMKSKSYEIYQKMDNIRKMRGVEESVGTFNVDEITRMPYRLNKKMLPFLIKLNENLKELKGRANKI